MDNNGDEILQQLLEQAEVEEAMGLLHTAAETLTPTESEDKDTKSDKENHIQWALGGNGRFMPVGSTASRLPAGIYEPFATPGMWGLEQLDVTSDGIYRLPDMATEAVLTEVNKFWNSEAKYRHHRLLYKRGLILWGPPGGGKSVTVKLLMNELVARNGVVLMASNINLTIMCLKAIRRIEPQRNLIVVLEDIDEIINHNGEAVVLSMLDGENNIDRVLNLATTNYPERLGARIINRPSRFDRRIYVGMPGPDARSVYLDKATGGGLDTQGLQQWVADTDGLSIAHLRELVAAVYCLEQPYDDVLSRLQEMSKQVTSEEEFKRIKVGFGLKKSPSSRVFFSSPEGASNGG